MKKLSIIIPFILSLVACSVDIYPQHIEKAKELCSDKGGIYKMWTIYSGVAPDFVNVTCINSYGTAFRVKLTN